MDFVISLPISTNWKTNNYDAILIIVDYFTKMIHYKQVKTTIDIADLVKIIINMLVRHHGLPKSIISDRDLPFTSKFWFSPYYFINIK